MIFNYFNYILKMWGKLKSQLIKKIIFSHVTKKIKLNFAKYNKNLQNINELSLTDYKIISGKFITFENNGKGKIYNINNGNIIFEGEYLNGEKNGKGKEYYYNGILKYDGEYLNGYKSGKGKEYYDNGDIRFEGEYLYGHIIKGKLYINKRLEYEGEYLFYRKWNGKGFNENGNVIYTIKNGKGKIKEYYNGYLMFEGEYLNGKRHSKGKEYEEGTLVFEGEYYHGERK